MFAVLALGASQSYAGAHGADAELVLVAGATGRTGRLVVTELIDKGFRVRAFVRDTARAREALGDDIEYAQGDVRDRASIDAALTDVSALISAIGATRDDPANSPEFVDFGGVKNLGEAAAAAELRHVVLISSGGVTQEDHVLNRMFNNVLIWKFKGEEVVRGAGVPYTIVRPGGLVDKPAGAVTLTFAQGDAETGVIARGDVAAICVAALLHEEARNKTLEAFSGEGAGPNDFATMFAALESD